eukprot:GHVL01011852.1.p1 GENE.GHVL01011852.1~~GHVL01011852.1.p1  ORF type:complete len:398 (+),score=81.67 GHVL01011852.1:70-1263(+)
MVGNVNAIRPPTKGNFLFTSESVNEGHPDKLCDQVSDAILDACLLEDPHSRVACETCTKTNLVMVFGEISTKAKIDYEKVVRETCARIGYDDDSKGLDSKKMEVIVAIESQSPDIAQCVHENKNDDDIGAGDQGHMFGYATDETKELMPLSHSLATKLGHQLTQVRKNGPLTYLRPDGKTQVTVEYKEVDGHMIPQRVHTIVISTQHGPDVTNEKLRADLFEHVVKKVVPSNMMDKDTICHLNPSGKFIIGGPHADSGLTGRKIIIDTYGGWGAHGGGAFSGKDSTKVDRSAAYAARWAAKSLVAQGLCKRVLVQLSYSIGISHPLSLYVSSYGTVKEGKTDEDLTQIVLNNFDFRPGVIIKELGLTKPIFSPLAAYGHFGRNDLQVSWETPKSLKI